MIADYIFNQFNVESEIKKKNFFQTSFSNDKRLSPHFCYVINALIIAIMKVHNGSEVIVLEFFNGLHRLSSHVAGQEFKIFALVSCSHDQAEQNEAHEHEPRHVPLRQQNLSNAHENRNHVQTWRCHV